MSETRQLDLRAPDLKLGPLVMWVHGYETLDSEDPDDANWLRVTLHCGGQGARVEVTGSILQTFDLTTWCDEIQTLSESLAGEAVLRPVEPNLVVRIHGLTLGRMQVEVDITADPMHQEHRFSFGLDQSHLASLVGQLKSILRHWPVRWSASPGAGEDDARNRG